MTSETVVLFGSILFGIFQCSAVAILFHTYKLLCCSKEVKSDNKPQTGNTPSNTVEKSASRSNDDELPTANDIHKYIRITTLIALSTNLLPTTLYFFRMFLGALYGNDWAQNNYNRYGIVGQCVLLFYLIGRCVLLLLFILRIDLTFRDSVYQFSSRTLKILYSTSIIQICYYLFIEAVVLFPIPIINDEEVMIQIRTVTSLIALVYEVILISIMITVFVRKLFKLFVKTLEYNHTKGIDMADIEMSSSSSNKSANEQVSEELLYAMIKYTILVVGSIMSSLICVLLILLWGSGWLTMWMFLGIDQFINGCCVYLVNPFANKIYNKLCKVPHLCCKQCCNCCVMCC